MVLKVTTPQAPPRERISGLVREDNSGSHQVTTSPQPLTVNTLTLVSRKGPLCYSPESLFRMPSGAITSDEGVFHASSFIVPFSSSMAARVAPPNRGSHRRCLVLIPSTAAHIPGRLATGAAAEGGFHPSRGYAGPIRLSPRSILNLSGQNSGLSGGKSVPGYPW